MAYKIGIVTEYYYPLLGGVTENVHHSRVRLKNLGYDVKIITSNCKKVRFPVDEKCDFNDPEIIRTGHSIPIYSNRSFGHLTIGTNLMSKMRRILEAEKFDLIHIHSPIVLSLPAIALLTAKCALVGTFHTYFESSVVYSAFRNRIQQKGLDKLNGQIAVSKSCIESLSHYFKMHARIIPNGVDINQFSPDIPRLKKYDDDKMNLLFLGRFDPRNGLTFMLKAFEIIKSHYSRVRLIVVGDGSLSFYYKGRIPKSISQDINFEGLAKDKRPSYYASCDIFCSPVTKASFGVTLLEAMASGKPIVATENVGYKDLLSPHESFLVSSNDFHAFAEAVLRLLKDEQLRKEMGLNGRKKALAYSWDKIVQDINDYYKEILNGK